MSPEERLRKIHAEATNRTLPDFGTLQQLARIAELAREEIGGIPLTLDPSMPPGSWRLIKSDLRPASASGCSPCVLARRSLRQGS